MPKALGWCIARLRVENVSLLYTPTISGHTYLGKYFGTDGRNKCHGQVNGLVTLCDSFMQIYASTDVAELVGSQSGCGHFIHTYLGTYLGRHLGS